jgi:predicted O-methyltransferase YrrM
MELYGTDGPKNLPIKKLLFFFLKYFFGLFSCIYLFLVGFIFSRNRDLINKISAHFRLSSPVGGRTRTKPLIPKRKLSELLDYEVPVRIIEIEGIAGNTGISELYVLNFFARKFRCSSILEIGTIDGRTALNLAINSVQDAKTYTIDLPKDTSRAIALPVTRGDNVYINRNVTGERHLTKDRKAFPEVDKIVQLFGDSATFDFTPYFNKIDMVFVDGAHSYEYVKNDSHIAMKMLKNGKGLIIWHDYDALYDEVTLALNEISAQHPEIVFAHIEGTSLVYARL